MGSRHDIVVLFDATKVNPNGDPDTGNMPRLQPDTLRGLVTDVCLKRKVRNFFLLYNPNGELRGDNSAQPGSAIFIRENAILKDILDSDEVRAEASRLFNESLARRSAAIQNDASELLECNAFDLKSKTKGLNEIKKKQAKALVKTLTDTHQQALFVKSATTA